MKDHHIVPYSRLRDTWNTLVENNEARVLESYIDVFSPDADFARACKRFVTGRDGRDHTISTTSGALGRHVNSAMNAEVIASELFWAPWNLVEGPGRRTDDPGDGTDMFSFTGIDNAYWRNHYVERQRILEHLSGCMKRYLDGVAGRNGASTAVLRSLKDAFDETAHISTRDRIDFDRTRSIWQTRSADGLPPDFRNVDRTRRNSRAGLEADPRLRAGDAPWTTLS